MLCSLISSRDIRLRATRKEREGGGERKKEEEALSLYKKKKKRLRKFLFSCVKPRLLVRKCVGEWGAAVNCFGAPADNDKCIK